jgi:hypothetical protein
VVSTCSAFIRAARHLAEGRCYLRRGQDLLRRCPWLARHLDHDLGRLERWHTEPANLWVRFSLRLLIRSSVRYGSIVEPITHHRPGYY